MKRTLALFGCSLLVCSLLVTYLAVHSSQAHTAAVTVQSPDSHAPDQPVGGILSTIAVKPNNGNIIVAAFLESLDGPCTSVRSLDGGQTWVDPFILKDVEDSFGEFGCDTPVVRWSPDSSKVYAAFIGGAWAPNNDHNVVFLRSSADNGKTWSNPIGVIAVSSLVGSFWLDVHTFPSSGPANSKVYVIAESSGIVFAASTDHGASFRPQQFLNLNRGALPRIIGGNDQDVLACWIDSDVPDTFDIRCRASSNFGLSFGKEFTAVNNKSFPLSYVLGLGPPGDNESDYIWYDGMAPSLMITNNGVAHIAFTADPVKGSSTPEEGDIFYVRSRRPYSGTSWTAPLRLNDGTDHKAQGHPTITAKRDPNSPTGHVLSVCWEDHRNSVVDNDLYDVYCDRTLTGWGPDIRISDSSYATPFFSGSDSRASRLGPVDSSASRVLSDRSIHVIWSGFSEKTLLP
jgi:hypothetical protein